MFGKIFEQIFDSSIADDYELRHFFMDMIVLADVDGVVDMTPTALAARTRIPRGKVKRFLECLEGPDPESRTPEHEGRRIERLDPHRTWGWRIINYLKFREIASEAQRKHSQKERFKRWKERHLGSANAPLTPANAPLTVTNGSNAMQKQRHKHKHKHNKPPIIPLKGDCPYPSEKEKESTAIGDLHDREQGYHSQARVVLRFLNETCGKHYREVDANLRMITARLREKGVTLEGVKAMVLRMSKAWRGTDMEKYLRPETLFRASKFDGYYSDSTYGAPPPPAIPVRREIPIGYGNL